MGKAVITGCGGGGAGSDECTATRAEVLKGYKAITKDSDDELIEGTLELTGTAADSQVLSGQTYYNTDVKTKRSGAMANRGAVSQALNAGGSYTIPAGFHNGSGKVTANGLSGQTSATAAAGQILSGQTAWVNGNKITGNMANQGTKTASLNCGGNYTIPAGYHNGSGKVTANSLASQTGGVTADDSKVLSGYTYWKDGTKRTGNMTVSSVVSFSAAQYSNLTLIASWAKPSKGPWSGVRIMCKQGSYPSSTNDGTLFYEGSGTSATKSLAAGTWYLRAWNYMTTSLGHIYGGYSQTTCTNNSIKGTKTFTSSATFTVPSNVRSIDVFCVGGGGKGADGSSGSNGGGGGGGGYTSTVKAIVVIPGQQINVTIGAAGSTTLFGSYCTAKQGDYALALLGADGGSGGGTASWKGAGVAAGAGGSNGNNGGGSSPGKGQRSTTRAFGETTGTLYAGGGGGGGNNQEGVSVRGLGGAGGGGNGADAFNGGSAATAGTGGGGGGGYGYGNSPGNGYAGGSGVCIVRWGY